MVRLVCVASLSPERASNGPQQSSQYSLGLGVRVFFPEFLIAQIGFSSKLEPAAQLGVASVLQLGDEPVCGCRLGNVRFGLQKEAFVPEDGLKRSIRYFHFDLSIKPPAQVIEPGDLIGVVRRVHGIDWGG